MPLEVIPRMENSDEEASCCTAILPIMDGFMITWVNFYCLLLANHYEVRQLTCRLF